MPRSGKEGRAGERLVYLDKDILGVGRSTSQEESVNPSLKRTSKRVDGNQDTSDIRIDLSVLPPFRKIFVHSFIRDGREQCHVRHANLFLLETFFPIGLHAPLLNNRKAQNMRATDLRDFVIPSSRFLGCGSGLLARLLGDGLSIDHVNGEWKKGRS